MSVTNRSKAKEIKAKRDKVKQMSQEVQTDTSRAFHKMMDDFHSMNIRNDYKLDTQILQWKIEEMSDGKKNLRGEWDESIPTFSPSGVDSCERQLAFKIIGAEEDEQTMEPYQRRWVKNGSAVHERQQSDLLYIEKYLKDAPFEVCRTKEGKPAWERNTRTVKQFEHNGQKFQIYGMVDGMLFDKVRGKRIGYDFKTKSTTVATVGDYKLKVPQENNVTQMVAYSLLFDVDEYLIHYESVAKDGWTKGKEAKPDMKVFHIVITEEMKKELLDKLARVAQQVSDDILPDPDFNKCLFCPFKQICADVEESE